MRERILAKAIPVERDHWGRPTVVIKNMDGNEVFFWLSESEFAKLESERPELKSKGV
jgi:hypothetical protein